ncbi:MAG: hypothetical protein KDK48_03090 [Chlamydiia bacterium]|nr:hypothetical protein [Chlamydiia bacterium]
MLKGVIVGTDSGQEWVLPVWWHWYRLHNTLPVTFFDFFMSEKIRAFCSERGEVKRLEFPENFVKGREAIDPDLIQRWELFFSPISLWGRRPFAFLKALAAEQSPYDISLWLDLDCEVLLPLEPLFGLLKEPYDFAACISEFHRPYLDKLHVTKILKPEELWINAGVFLFRKKCPLIFEWALKSLQENDRYLIEEHILSELVHAKKESCLILDPTWNWQIAKLGKNKDAAIVHYANIRKSNPLAGQ